MSDDDRLDYRQMFPIEGRNRKRFVESPRKPTEPKKTYGFFSSSVTEERAKKSRRTRRDLGKRYEDDASRRPGLERMIRILVAEDLNRSAKSIATELDGLGYEAAPLTVSVVRQEMMAVLQLCHQYGSITVPAWDED